MRQTALLALALALLLSGALPVQAAPSVERRIALVIGNAAYPTAPLKNPVNDARDMATALRGLGFEVIARENASLAQMEGAVNEFWGKLKRGGSGLFYFAGHGLQVNGRNYLVPVDARLEAEQDAKYKCMDAGLVLGRMENAGNELNIIILDACRNNPFARSWRSADVGLAKMDAPRGSLIAYATAPGSVAADGAGKNGLYTEKLLRAMRAPGQPVEQMFKRVRDEVMRETKDKQVPWESTSLRGDFYFTPGAGAPAPTALAPAVAAAPHSTPPAPTQLALAATPKQAPPPPATAGEHKAGDTWTDPVTGMEFVWVPGGTFEMGCGPWTGGCSSNGFDTPVHTVRLDGFWLGKYEVTQGQWQKVMGSNPSKFKKGDNYPVERMSWGDAKSFGVKLSTLGIFKFRLPTEAEWEYAARSGGKEEEYAGSEEVDLVAWYEDNSGGSSHAVGTKAPNGLGLYDMSGNVGEWIEDVYRSYTAAPQENPVFRKGASATVAGTDIPARLDRGGSWLSRPGGSTTYNRVPSGPEPYGHTGLRLVRIP